MQASASLHTRWSSLDHTVKERRKAQGLISSYVGLGDSQVSRSHCEIGTFSGDPCDLTILEKFYLLGFRRDGCHLFSSGFRISDSGSGACRKFTVYVGFLKLFRAE